MKVTIDPRKKRRDMQNALGDNILRYITELLTNSDDSYKRLESDYPEQVNDNIIYIALEKDRRSDGFVLSVTDHAEGMSKETLEQKFGNYAGDNARGIVSHARGIFGQGASDVLKAAANEKKTAKIETFYNNKLNRLIYNIDENLDGDIDVNEINVTGNQLKQLRDNLNIPGNGTKLSFGIPSTVKFTKKIIDSLPESIEKYPYLRYLLNQNNRRIVYTFNGTSRDLTSESYQFKDDSKIYDNDFMLFYEGNKYKCHLNMYKNENKSEDGTNIIVRDEYYSVYDNTMFDFKNSPSAQNISGELIIEGMYELCYDHLNREQAEAIVYDNRTGFDTRTSFYQELNKVLHPILDRVIKENGKNVSETNLGNNKKFNDALKVLNKYIKSELKEAIGGGPGKGTIPPKEGIKFVRNNISITKGKTYDLKLLINPAMIDPNTKIYIINNNPEQIEISPNFITYSYEDIDVDIVTKDVTIKGIELTNESSIVQAKAQGYISNVLVDVIEDTIHYPENGLEFYPKDLSLVVDKPHSLDLYVDTDIIPIKSTIEINCADLDYSSKVEISDSLLIADKIAKVKVVCEGGEIDKTYDIVANYNDIESICKLTLTEPTKNDNPNGGFIAGFKLEPNPMFFQSYFDLSTRYIKINTTNPINVRILGNMDDLDQDNPKFNKEQSKYLCDIIATQAARSLVKQQNVKNGEVNFEDYEDAVEQVQDLIQQHKNKIYSELYGAIIGMAEDK